MGDEFKLSGLTGQYSGQEFPLEPGEHIVGRGEGSDLQLMDPRVSRQHARLTLARDACRIVDMGSTDGTYLNGERVTEAALKDGDKLRFGGSVFLFHAPSSIPTGQDAIPTLLDVSTSAPTSLAGAAEDRPQAEATRVSSSAPQPEPPAGAPARTPPAVAPPGPPAGEPPAAPVRRPPAWRWILYLGAGLAGLALVVIVLLMILGGAESGSTNEVAQATTVFDAPTAGPTWTPLALIPAATDSRAAPPTAQPVTEPTTGPLPTATTEAALPMAASDRDQIAFVSDRSGRPQIYLITIESGEIVQLTDLPSGACQPAWNPDGERLAFISPCSVNREEYSGTSIYLLHVGAQETVSGPTPLISSLTGGEYDPAWSPDGSEIAFTSLRTGRPQIFVAAADGSGERNLNNDLAYNWSPSWAPDGSRLAFLSGRSGQEEIWLVPSGGGEETRFTRGDGKNVNRPSWSPDGAAIVFEKVVGNIPRLIAAPLADGGVREVQVCQEGGLSLQPMGEPAWSTDGSWLVFATWPDGVSHRIAILRPGCSEYQELTPPGSIDFDPAWRPAP
ncbi:MAG: FHA domain-containing protein [Anaerolineales bacterium]